MSDINIDSLRIEAKTNIKDAISDIESLKQSLTGLGDGKSGLDRYSASVNGLTQKLTHLTKITDKSGIAAVEKAIRELAEEAIKLNNLQLDEKKGSIFSEATWNEALKNVENAMDNVKNTIASKMREIKPLEGVEKDFDNYIRKAGKVKIPIGVKNDLKVDKEFANLRSVLGKNFSTTNNGVDFVKFVEDMNNAIHTTFDTTQNATDLFKEVVNSLKDIRKEATLTAQDVIKNGLLPVKEIEAELSKFTAKDIPDLNEKYNLNESELYAGKSEESSVKELANSVKEVTTTVNQKTKAFEKEQKTVADVVKFEMKELINLRTTIESVTKAVSARSGLTQAFEDLSNSGLKDLASLKSIDFSGIAKLNIKALQETIKQNITDVKNIGRKTTRELARNAELENALGFSSPENLIAKTTVKGNEINIPAKLSEIQSLYQKLINYKGALIESINETWNSNNTSLDAAVDKILKYREQLAQTRSSIKQVGEVLAAVRSETDITKGEQWLAEYNSFLGNMQEYRTKISQELLETLQTEPQNSPKLNLMESLSDLGTVTDSVEQKLSELFDMLQALPSATDKAESQARTMLTQSAQQLGLAAESIENALSTLHGTVKEYSTASETSAPIDDLNNHVNLVAQSLSSLDSALQLTQNEVRTFAETGQLSETALQALSNASQTSDMVIDHMNSSISELTGNLSFYRQSLEQAAQEPSIFKDMPEDINRLDQNVQKLPFSLSKMKSDINDLAGIMGGFSGKAMSAVTTIGKIGSMAVSTSKKIGSLIKDFAKLSWKTLNFGSNNNALAGLKNPLNQSSASLGDFNKKLKHGIATVLRYGFGIRSLYVLFNKLRSGIQDGFNNLVIYSDKANQSLSLLQADLSYVGNSAAAAFEPILNVVAPIIDQIVDYMVAGINSVGAFIAAITGQSSYTVAIKNIKSYRDSLSGAASAGDAASDATDKVKDSAADLKRELMGFDEIEKFSEDLNNAANSGSGSGGGNGSGNGTEDPILFTKKDIPGAVSNFADLVKDAWAKADFTEIGNIVGTKLRDALDSIDWEPIKAQANKIARVTGTFINGFFETEGLDKSVGRTVGEALNTAIGTVNTFIDVTHWSSIGKFMSGGLRSAIDTIDWDGLGKTLNAKYTALWGFVDGFVVDMSRIDFEGTTGWQEAGNALAETINSIFANRDYEKVGTTIANGINGIASTLETGVNKIEFNKISQRFANGVNNVFSGVDFNAIGSAISSGLNQATSSLQTFSVTINWKKIGRDIANSANTFLADTDFSLAGKALGSAFKGVLSSINEAAATFNWRSLGVDINHFIKGINWKGVLKTAANTVANTFFGLFEAAWGVVFGGSDTKYTAIADNLNQALSKLKIEWPAMEQEEIEKFNNVSTIVDKFLELNDKLKKNGSLSETDMSLFKTYYDQIVEYAPQAADLIGKVGEAYEGTDKALKDLIESQKNAAITKGFEQAITDIAKNVADSAIALDGAVTELVNSVTLDKDEVFQNWHDILNKGTMEEFEASLESLFKKMRDGKLDMSNLSKEENRLMQAFQNTNYDIITQVGNVQGLTENLNDSTNELNKVTEAEQNFANQNGIAATKIKKSSNVVAGSYKTILKNAEAVDSKNRTMQEHIAVWLSDLTNLSELEKSALFDYMTGVTERSSTVDNAISKLSKSQQQKIEATGKAWRTVKNDVNGYATELDNLPSSVTTEANFKVDKSEIYKTGKDLLNNPLELNSKMVVSGVDKSKLTDEDKTFNTTARFKNMIDSLGDKIFPTIANFISQIDSLPAVGKIFSTVAKFTSKEDAIGDRKISNLTAMLTNITTAAALVVPSASAVVTKLISSSGLSVANVKGLINQVTKQSGASLILSGIHGIISSITSIFGRKAEGGAFYGGSWHDIPQFSNGGIIKPNMMLNFNMIPRYAGGTLDGGSMFIAGEAGPELVGHVGGRTEVLNQSQLASVMQSAVASGMEAVMARYGGNGGGNGNVTVNVVLQGDAKKIFEVVKKENNSRVIQTGKAQLLT